MYHHIETINKVAYYYEINNGRPDSKSNRKSLVEPRWASQIYIHAHISGISLQKKRCRPGSSLSQRPEIVEVTKIELTVLSKVSIEKLSYIMGLSN